MTGVARGKHGAHGCVQQASPCKQTWQAQQRTSVACLRTCRARGAARGHPQYLFRSQRAHAPGAWGAEWHKRLQRQHTASARLSCAHTAQRANTQPPRGPPPTHHSCPQSSHLSESALSTPGAAQQRGCCRSGPKALSAPARCCWGRPQPLSSVRPLWASRLALPCRPEIKPTGLPPGMRRGRRAARDARRMYEFNSISYRRIARWPHYIFTLGSSASGRPAAPERPPPGRHDPSPSSDEMCSNSCQHRRGPSLLSTKRPCA